MAAYGLYTHIQSNKRRSIALLIGLFVLVYLLVYAGALVGEALTNDAPLDELMRAALRDALYAAPWATLGTALWILIAYKFHQAMIDAVTGGREVTRQEEPRLYNLLENLCISRGITMPKLKVIEDDSLNAFATGMNAKQYSITVTSGLINSLDDAEIESVLGHELTHIRNGDVRMLVIAVIIAGVIAFFAELVFRLMFQGGVSWRSSRSDGDRKGAGVAILVALVLIAIAWVLSIVIRFALSRQREYLADSGSVELTWRCASTIRAGAFPTFSIPIRRSMRAWQHWSSSRAATIRGRWRCRSRVKQRRPRRPKAVTNPAPVVRGAPRRRRRAEPSRSCPHSRRSRSAVPRPRTAKPARGDRTGNST
jgi:heat shock protein HtpX